MIITILFFDIFFQDNSSLQFLFNNLTESDIDYFVNYNLGELQANSSINDTNFDKCVNDTSLQQEDSEERVCNLGFAQIKIENFRVSIFLISFLKSLNLRAGNEGARKDVYAIFCWI